MNWTGTQWSAPTEVLVNIGLMTAGSDAAFSIIDPRFIRPLPDPRIIQVRASWEVIAPGTDFPVIISCGIVDFTTGELELQLFNQRAVDTNFSTRGLIVEVSVPFVTPP